MWSSQPGCLPKTAVKTFPTEPLFSPALKCCTIRLRMEATIFTVPAVSATATDPAGNTSEFSACAPCNPFGYGPIIELLDANTLAWSAPSDVRWVMGDVAGLSTYATTDGGSLTAATTLDISTDNPAPGTTLYYLLRTQTCGSWQTAPAAQPPRDTTLP